MIDIQFVRDNPELVKQKAKQKGVEVDVDELFRLDVERKELLQRIEALRQRRNEISDSTSGGKPEPSAIEEAKNLKLELAEREGYLNETEAQCFRLLTPQRAHHRQAYLVLF